MRVSFVRLSDDKCVANVNLQVLPKIDERVLVFGKKYDVIDIKHFVEITDSASDDFVKESLTCELVEVEEK